MTRPASQERRDGALLLVGAVGVFVVCAIIQSACGSSMFSGSYQDTGLVETLLINMTFYPGWILTGSLALRGGLKLYGAR